MRKYLLPTLLVLALSASVSVAQVINKALQLSQDATGAFSVDSFNGVYFPGHVLSPTGGQRPAPTVAVVSGSGTPTIVGTDTAGTVTMGTSSTNATVTFGTAYGSTPSCVVTTQSAISSPTSVSYTPAAATLVLTQPSGSGNKINYLCFSAS